MEDEDSWTRQSRKRCNVLQVYKSQAAYLAFNAERPREGRNPACEPMSPDPMEPCSKRRWLTRFSNFKSSVNAWYDERHPAAKPEVEVESQDAGPVAGAVCTDPRHYALTVCCPCADLYCSCKKSKFGPTTAESGSTGLTTAASGSTDHRARRAMEPAVKYAPAQPKVVAVAVADVAVCRPRSVSPAPTVLDESDQEAPDR